MNHGVPLTGRGPRLDVERLPEVTAALAARAEEHDRAGSFPADGIGSVHAAGLLTATVAGRYGGPGEGWRRPSPSCTRSAAATRRSP